MRFGPEACSAIVARLEVGMSFREACDAADIKLGTAQGWRARGKRETEGAYHEFTKAVEAALHQEQVEAMTPEEHRAKVSEVARKGNVQALKLYWEMICADRDEDEAEEPADPLEEYDELAERRAAK